jgi:hypothetical protein
MLSAMAAFPSRSMVTISSALASSSWARMREMRGLFWRRFGAALDPAVRPLDAPLFLAVAVSVDVLFERSTLHQDSVWT